MLRRANGSLYRIRSIARQHHNTTINAYNAEGELSSVTDPLGMVWEYAYDGNRNSRLDAEGDLTEYAFPPAKHCANRRRTGKYFHFKIYVVYLLTSEKNETANRF